MIGSNNMATKYNEGNDAFKYGKMNNPYKKNTHWNREWLRGFNSAYFRNLERVDRNETKRRSKETHENNS